MARLVVGLEYDGAPFCGWQSQRGGCGVQDAAQRALSPANGSPPIVHAAGRTDAGVHAALQIAHFDAAVSRPPEMWRRAANARLPRQIRMLWAHPAPPDFHARHSAVRRFYQYIVVSRPVSPALMGGFAAFCPSPPSPEKMREGAARLLGRRDFSAFRAASCQAKTPLRTIYEAEVRRRGELIIFDFCADGFLHKMVRNIVGALLQIGRNGRGPEWIEELLRNKTRADCPPPAPPSGLYFTGAEYSPPFAPPETRRLPFFSPPFARSRKSEIPNGNAN
ncbi:MAG: tRNA pseudouridine(38-40) synthase TruA [Gammaproteobacteria bacterium]